MSGFENAAEMTLGRLEAPDDLELQLDEGGFTVLPLSMRHGLVAGALPVHHRDPFDRLLIAQAQSGVPQFVSTRCPESAL